MRMYDTPRWRKLRDLVLLQEPLCRMCSAMGRVTMATVVDHITPHKGNQKLMWDRANLQALCASCHSGNKRMQEAHGYSQACGQDGLPLDQKHPWK